MRRIDCRKCRDSCRSRNCRCSCACYRCTRWCTHLLRTQRLLHLGRLGSDHRRYSDSYRSRTFHCNRASRSGIACRIRPQHMWPSRRQGLGTANNYRRKCWGSCCWRRSRCSYEFRWDIAFHTRRPCRLRLLPQWRDTQCTDRRSCSRCCYRRMCRRNRAFHSGIAYRIRLPHTWLSPRRKPGMARIECRKCWGSYCSRRCRCNRECLQGTTIRTARLRKPGWFRCIAHIRPRIELRPYR